MSQQQSGNSANLAASGDVRDFYERYPYPRPVDSLEAYRLLWQNPERRRADHHLFWPRRAFKEELSILIAGCGTSQAAKHAMRWPEARVIGIDFSETSIRCTEELKRKHKLDNLEVRRLPLERAAELDERFDQIVCTGVLHHLADPGAGLRALHALLKADGAMHLMVYAPYGRAGIYMLQEFCRQLRIQATDGEIRDLMDALRLLPRGHPLETLLREAPDFRQEAALADALLNPQDRAYSVPQFFDLIGSSGLTFGRWVRQAPYSAQCGNVAKIHQVERLLKLSQPQQFAAVELFRGMIIRHSAIVYRSDSAANPQPVNFNGDAWRSYIPIRMHGAICVEDRLPAGAAAVLLNQSHPFKDILLPIDAKEKSLFDAIDGSKLIGQIAQRELGDLEGSMRDDLVRGFFERLFLYDQVVFDISRQPPEPGVRAAHVNASHEGSIVA